MWEIWSHLTETLKRFTGRRKSKLRYISLNFQMTRKRLLFPLMKIVFLETEAYLETYQTSKMERSG